MKLIPDDRQIYISARLWHEIQSKVRLAPFIHALHDGIDLSKYGNGIEKIYFTYIIVKPHSINNETYARYYKKYKKVDMALAIPYERAREASRLEMIQLMQETYLEGIDQLSTLPIQGTFDAAAFRKDVEAIFAVDKWYELALDEAA